MLPTRAPLCFETLQGGKKEVERGRVPWGSLLYLRGRLSISNPWGRREK